MLIRACMLNRSNTVTVQKLGSLIGLVQVFICQLLQCDVA